MSAIPEEVFTRSLTGFALITIGFIVLFFGITLIMMEMVTPSQPQTNQTGTVIVIFPFLFIRTGYISPLWIMLVMISFILLFFLIVYMITRYMFRGAHY
ncbi:MAG: hypothetical protein F7C37_06950 [Desulfurococcales archaeon]|nr:hypothetical protein [Desulfurococcales archaeon]